MNKIISIQNSIAQVEWRNGSEYALLEVDASARVGDEVPNHGLVYNGGERSYDELYGRFIDKTTTTTQENKPQ